ncbi:hypothetical protein J4E86_004361 [Alternaria arbusti]|uniref:uncharacterized protein n=1 Tax=Alternaria arbusti TaxID=232088 RepID=UPI00221F1AE7|nr:uncharacterized protein J4E86_004361 [Alternaria arbusti]KAI4958755.1 hypothetical protein J4E86_004361 [Alternaria arbusti]
MKQGTAYNLSHPTLKQTTNNAKDPQARQLTTQQNKTTFTLRQMKSMAQAKVVMLTEYTTVYPTEVAQATFEPSASTTAAVSLSASLSSKIPEPTISISSAIPSQTLPPTSSTTVVPLGPERHFDDTPVIVILSLFILFAILLIAMIGYLVFMRFKGKCSSCQDLQEQISKWECGELKRITPQMVMKRDMLNKTPWAHYTSSELDQETGYLGHKMSRAPTIYQVERERGPSLFQKIKARIVRGGKSSTPPDLPTNYNDGHRYSARSSAYSASTYYDPEKDDKEMRIFTEVSAPDVSSARGPLRKESEEPKRYTAYASTEHDEGYSLEKEINIAHAMACLESKEYKDANAVLQRQSATDSEMRRALGFVNTKDQQMKVALHPSLYSEVDKSLYESPAANTSSQAEEYQPFSWRKKGRRPPDLGD